MSWWRRRKPEPEPDPAAEAEAARVAAALEGGPLGGRGAEALRIRGTDEHAVLVRIDPGEVLDAWRAARVVLGVTGRRPLAVTAFVDGLADESILTTDGDAADAAAVARTMTREQALATLGATGREMEEYDASFGLGDEDDGGHLGWFVPERQETAIAFLPTTAAEEAVAYAGLFPWDRVEELAALVTLARGWHERYGAELVAGWGTMLQFVVERPPADVEAARELAFEQLVVASDTIMLPGVLPDAHARALVGRRTWFLHSRP